MRKYFRYNAAVEVTHRFCVWSNPKACMVSCWMVLNWSITIWQWSLWLFNRRSPSNEHVILQTRGVLSSGSKNSKLRLRLSIQMLGEQNIRGQTHKHTRASMIRSVQRDCMIPISAMVSDVRWAVRPVKELDLESIKTSNSRWFQAVPQFLLHSLQTRCKYFPWMMLERHESVASLLQLQ